MATIEIKNLTFAYEGSYDNVFENVDLRLDTSWRLGLVGRNGCGKTTLLNLLQGKLKGSGKIITPLEVGYFPYTVPDPGRNTCLVAEELLGEVPFWQFLRELGLLQMDMEVLERSYDTLSGGEQARVQLAALFAGEDRFLLIDEPTNHLDMEGRKVIGEYLKSKQGFILVSHDRTLLDESVDHILAVNRADIVLRQGNFSAWWQDKQQQDALELRQNEKLKKDIGRLEAASRRTAGWSDKVEKTKSRSANNGASGGAAMLDKGFVGHKAEKMMQRAKNLERRRENAVEEKKGLLKNIEQSDSLKITGLPARKGKMIEFLDVDIFYGEKTVCRGLRFSLEAGEHVSIQGPNGCGKSTILKLILGQDIAHTGLLHRMSGLTISYVPQDASFLRGSLSAYAEEKGIDLSQFMTILRKLGFSRTQVEKDMADFSAGQKKKVLLAGSLCQRAHLYIWDEPLNYIDLISRLQIEELLKNADISMLFVEHDEAFCREIATKTVQL